MPQRFFSWFIVCHRAGQLGQSARRLLQRKDRAPHCRFPAGGGSDAEGRVVARHIGKYIPGNPTLIVQNMRAPGIQLFEDLAKPDRCVHRVFAPRKTSPALVQQLRDAFARLEDDKELWAELKKVGGDDADLLVAKDAEPVLRQVLTVTSGVQEFVKNITKKHLQR
jgi:hypothetical protein